jgi:hypothetical protein
LHQSFFTLFVLTFELSSLSVFPPLAPPACSRHMLGVDIDYGPLNFLVPSDPSEGPASDLQTKRAASSKLVAQHNADHIQNIAALDLTVTSNTAGGDVVLSEVAALP